MKIITGICDGKRYKLSLTSKRLTQLSRPQKDVEERLFVLLQEFKQMPDSDGLWARLRSSTFPGDLNDRTFPTHDVRAHLNETARSIGCTTFSKSAWKQIKAAIAAAK